MAVLMLISLSSSLDTLEVLVKPSLAFLNKINNVFQRTDKAQYGMKQCTLQHLKNFAEKKNGKSAVTKVSIS